MLQYLYSTVQCSRWLRAECHLTSIGAGGERPLLLLSVRDWQGSPLSGSAPTPTSYERGGESVENAETAAPAAEPAIAESESESQWVGGGDAGLSRPMSDQQQEEGGLGGGRGGKRAVRGGEVLNEEDESAPDASLLGSFLSDSASTDLRVYWLTPNTVGEPTVLCQCA